MTAQQLVVSKEEFQKRLPYASGQTVVCNEYLKNIKFLDTHCEVALGGANITNTISDAVTALGVSLLHHVEGYTYVQAIAEAIDYLVGENPTKKEIRLASGSSRDYAYLVKDKDCGKVFYHSPNGRTYLSAEFLIV